MGGRTPGTGGLRWPCSNAGCIAPVGGIRVERGSDGLFASACWAAAEVILSWCW